MFSRCYFLYSTIRMKLVGPVILNIFPFFFLLFFTLYVFFFFGCIFLLYIYTNLILFGWLRIIIIGSSYSGLFGQNERLQLRGGTHSVELYLIGLEGCRYGRFFFFFIRVSKKKWFKSLRE